MVLYWTALPSASLKVTASPAPATLRPGRRSWNDSCGASTAVAFPVSLAYVAAKCQIFGGCGGGGGLGGGGPGGGGLGGGGGGGSGGGLGGTLPGGHGGGEGGLGGGGLGGLGGGGPAAAQLTTSLSGTLKVVN